MGEPRYTKRNRQSGHFMDQRATSANSKGVRKDDSRKGSRAASCMGMVDCLIAPQGRVLHAAQAIIFDVEGTLVDCVPAILLSWQEVLRAFGHEVSRSRLQELSGRDTDELLAELLPQEPKAARARIGKEQGRHYRACYLDSVRSIPGVTKVLAELRGAGKRIALSTSCERDQLDHLSCCRRLRRPCRSDRVRG
jgi:hypothetical protein